MLGTGAAIGRLHPSELHPSAAAGRRELRDLGRDPVQRAGRKIYSRRSYAEGATSMFDYPLATRFDETDALLVYDDVFVPWEHVFIYKDIALTRASFFESAAHVLGNNQAQIRFAVKMKFLAGLVRTVAETTGSISLPPVQGALGDIAGLAALVEGLVLAQEAHCDDRRRRRRTARGARALRADGLTAGVTQPHAQRDPRSRRRRRHPAAVVGQPTLRTRRSPPTSSATSSRPGLRPTSG